MKYYIFLIIAIISFNSCIAQKCNLEGCWFNKNINQNTPDYLSLQLNCDKTFEYNISMDIIGKAQLKGTWSVHNDTLILDVARQEKKEVKKSIIEKYNDKSRTVRIISQDTIPLVGAMVIINNTDTLIADLEGKVQVKGKSIEKLEIKDFTLNEKVVFFPEDDKASSFIIYVYESPKELAVFEIVPKIWIIKEKRLYTPNGEGKLKNPLKKYSLKKCRIN